MLHSGRSFSEGPSVGHGGEARSDLSQHSSGLEHPKAVADECHLGSFVFTSLLVEKVTLAQEGLVYPPVSINTVDCSSLLFSIDCHSLVETLLVGADITEKQAGFLINSPNNFNCVGVNLTHRAHSC